jgi:hypothetical protein
LLHSCRRHLQVLSLSFGTYTEENALPSSSLFGENWCYVDLPHVRDLRIDPPAMIFGPEFVEYIHRFAPSLISLSIEPNLKLRYCQAEQLSSIFHDFLSLRNLSICTRCLCPDILGLFARTLPLLQTLSLRYSYISPTTDQAGRSFNDSELSDLVSL